MRPSKEPSVDKGHLSSVSWNLKTVAIGDSAANSEACSPHSSNALRAHRSADLVTEEGSEVIEPAIGKRPDAHSFERLRATEQEGEGLNHFIVFGVDVDPKVRPG